MRHALARILAWLDRFNGDTWTTQPSTWREHEMAASRRVTVLRELADENKRAKSEHRRGCIGTRSARYAKHHEKINYLLDELELTALDFEPIIEAPLVRTADWPGAV